MTQPPVIVRSATLADIPVMVEIHVRSWQWAYRNLIPDDYLDSLPATIDKRIEARRNELMHLPPQNRWWVAEQDGRIAGFALAGPGRDSNTPPTTAEVFAIYLSPDEVGKGVGRTLFAHTVEDLRQRGYNQAILWVLESNMRARRFYEAAGWEPDGGRKSDERPGATLHEVRYQITLQQGH